MTGIKVCIQKESLAKHKLLQPTPIHTKGNPPHAEATAGSIPRKTGWQVQQLPTDLPGPTLTHTAHMGNRPASRRQRLAIPKPNTTKLPPNLQQQKLKGKGQQPRSLEALDYMQPDTNAPTAWNTQQGLTSQSWPAHHQSWAATRHTTNSIAMLKPQV